jgi:tetratricopeptide (TPR) repeat protein
LKSLKLNAEQFPKSFNVWDSLGEAYYKAGNLKEAVKNYEESLRMNPDNEAGKRMLEKIRKERPWIADSAVSYETHPRVNDDTSISVFVFRS